MPDCMSWPGEAKLLGGLVGCGEGGIWVSLAMPHPSVLPFVGVINGRYQWWALFESSWMLPFLERFYTKCKKMLHQREKGL